MHIFAAQNTRSLKNIWSFPVQSLVFWIFLERHSQSFALNFQPLMSIVTIAGVTSYLSIGLHN